MLTNLNDYYKILDYMLLGESEGENIERSHKNEN